MASLTLRNCAECGKRGWFVKYCCDACKQRAYRKRCQRKRAGALQGTSSMLIDLIGEDKAMAVFEHLNRITGKGNQEQAGEAVAKIIYAVQPKMNDWYEENYRE